MSPLVLLVLALAMGLPLVKVYADFFSARATHPAWPLAAVAGAVALVAYVVLA